MDEEFSYCRIGVADSTFISIAIKNHKNYIENKKKLEFASDVPKYPNSDSEYSRLENELYENYACIIVFAAMFMESYIYDYAARNLGDSYVTNHLSKLVTISKWIIIPKIITNKEIDKTRNSFETFKRLIGLRNKIVHWKSQEGNHERITKSIEFKFYNALETKSIFDSIFDIFSQLQKMDDKDCHKFHVKQIEELIKEIQ